MINKDDYDCFDGYVDALEDAVKEYDQALERLPNRIEKVAFGIEAPNRHTPLLVSLAGEIRIELARIRGNDD